MRRARQRKRWRALCVTLYFACKTGKMYVQAKRCFMEAAKVGKRGAIIVPAKLRKRFGIEEGTLVTAEETDDGILIRPAMVVPVERYSPERKAELLLNNAVDATDYRKARKQVQKMGLNPDDITHRRPA